MFTIAAMVISATADLRTDWPKSLCTETKLQIAMTSATVMLIRGGERPCRETDLDPEAGQPHGHPGAQREEPRFDPLLLADGVHDAAYDQRQEGRQQQHRPFLSYG